jgi:hypothetical protein
LALAVSIFAYLDQHHADDLAGISQQQEYASKVTFRVIDEWNGKILRIQNSNSEPDVRTWQRLVSGEINKESMPLSQGSLSDPVGRYQKAPAAACS